MTKIKAALKANVTTGEVLDQIIIDKLVHHPFLSVFIVVFVFCLVIIILNK